GRLLRVDPGLVEAGGSALQEEPVAMAGVPVVRVLHAPLPARLDVGDLVLVLRSVRELEVHEGDRVALDALLQIIPEELLDVLFLLEDVLVRGDEAAARERRVRKRGGEAGGGNQKQSKPTRSDQVSQHGRTLPVLAPPNA